MTDDSMKFKVKRRNNEWSDTYTLAELLQLILGELDGKAEGPPCYNNRTVEMIEDE